MGGFGRSSFSDACLQTDSVHERRHLGDEGEDVKLATIIVQAARLPSLPSVASSGPWKLFGHCDGALKPRECGRVVAALGWEILPAAPSDVSCSAFGLHGEICPSAASLGLGAYVGYGNRDWLGYEYFAEGGGDRQIIGGSYGCPCGEVQREH